MKAASKSAHEPRPAGLRSLSRIDRNGTNGRVKGRKGCDLYPKSIRLLRLCIYRRPGDLLTTEMSRTLHFRRTSGTRSVGHQGN